MFSQPIEEVDAIIGRHWQRDAEHGGYEFDSFARPGGGSASLNPNGTRTTKDPGACFLLIPHDATDSELAGSLIKTWLHMN